MFENREEAGELLVKKLEQYRDRSNVIVFGIPRGGVVVAMIVAKGLGAPLDIVVIKKIGAPDNPELAIGAVGPLNIVYWDHDLIQKIGATKSQISKIKSQKFKEHEEREELLRRSKSYPSFAKKIIILVDDGVATGATAIAAAKFIKKLNAAKVILATPVIAKDTLADIKRYFDKVIFLDSPADFYAVGQFYKDFPQVSDDEVVEILKD